MKIVVWNANGLNQRALQLKHFLIAQKIYIALISETHFTAKSFIEIPFYDALTTNHPIGKGHRCGTAVIFKKSLKCTELQPYQFEHIQSTTIKIKYKFGDITISSIYSPPKHFITSDEFFNYLKTLGDRFQD